MRSSIKVILDHIRSSGLVWARYLDKMRRRRREGGGKEEAQHDGTCLNHNSQRQEVNSVNSRPIWSP